MNLAKKTKKRKCDECENEVGTMKTYLCDDCAYRNWDEGFSSQAEFAETMFEKQERVRKEKNKKINKKINRANPSDEDLKPLTTYYDGEVICSKCKKVRISYSSFGKIKNLLKTLKKPC